MFNIDEFSAIIGRHNPARASHYAVNITPPSTLNNNNIVSDLPYLCDSANLPGINIATDDFRQKGYGLTEKRPTMVGFEPVTLTFLGDSQGRILNFFHKWLKMVVNWDGEGGSDNGIESELFNYPEEYWGTVDIYLYDIEMAQYHSTTLHKAFPISVDSQQISWGMTDTLMRFTVAFAYRSFTTDQTTSQVSGLGINTLANSNARDLTQIERLLTNPNYDEYAQRLANTLF